MTPWSVALLCPWNFLGKITGGGCHFLLKGMFPTQGLNWILISGKDGGQEEKGMTEDEMVGWHHRLSGHESE